MVSPLRSPCPLLGCSFSTGAPRSPCGTVLLTVKLWRVIFGVHLPGANSVLPPLLGEPKLRCCQICPEGQSFTPFENKRRSKNFTSGVKSVRV